MVPPVIKQVKPTPSVVVPVENKPEKPQADPPVYNSPPKQPDASVSNSNQGNTVMIVENPPDNSEPEDQVSGNGLVIGIALGACAVLFIVLLSFLGYKMYRRRRHNKKYQSPPITPTRGSTPLQQVTLLPIAPHTHHSHSHHGRLNSDHERHRTATLSSHSDMRPPPSYNESFLDNGGPVVAV
ncbi:unnamed protein product [Clavelina lepadiformis]|uniref:Uncharacterized protein n=1 Tax=Clavelina lepadiformis TaxID=159417 RepID=A0ABP0F0Y3_CLALP